MDKAKPVSMATITNIYDNADKDSLAFIDSW